MDWTTPIFDVERVAPWLVRALVDRAVEDFAGFLLVLVRLSGLMILGPVFGQSTVPMNVRAILAIALAIMITPALPGHQLRGFQQLDQDGDGRLVAAELPDDWRERFAIEPALAERLAGPGLSADDYAYWAAPRTPQSVLEFATIAAGELVVGLLLGLGVMTVLAGLQLAGQLVDQQAGFSLGEIINPDFDSTGSVSGQALSYLGMTLFVVLEPLGGHLTLLRTLVGTFETLPLGAALVSPSAIDLIGGLVQAALVLGIRVAAPMMVLMTLVDLTLGFLGHSVPQVNLQGIGYAIRASICLGILVILLTGIPELVLDHFPATIEALGQSLTASSPAAG